MEDPPPSATWHPALRPETLDDASLYSPMEHSPIEDGPRLITLSWDDVVARTPMRSRAPTQTHQQIQQAISTNLEEDCNNLKDALLPEHEQAVEGFRSSSLHQEDYTGQGVSIEISEYVEPVLEDSIHSIDTGNPAAMEQVRDKDALLQASNSSQTHLNNNSEKEAKSTEVLNTHFVPLPEATSEERSTTEPETALTNGTQHKMEWEGSTINFFSSNPRQELGDDPTVDAAWGEIDTVQHTNSFLPVPFPDLGPSKLALAHSQAAAVIQEEQDLEMYNTNYSHQRYNTGPWVAAQNNFSNDDGSFSQPQLPVQGPSTPPDEEAKFEEGLPLVPQDASQSKEVDFSFEGHSAGDDFFSSAPVESLEPNTYAQPSNLGPAQQASDRQVSQGISSASWGQADDDFFGQTEKDTTQISSNAASSASVTNAPVAQPDLNAMWEAALDDDLLDDTMDPSSFFGNEDDGFLEDEDEVHAELIAASQPPHPAPHNVQSQGNQTNSMPTNISYTPAGFDVAAYQRSQSPYQTQPLRPAITTPAESFVSKSKDGYASPYDAPMDLSRPRRATTQRGPHILTRNGSAAAPPPRRSDSVQSGYAPTPTGLDPSPATPAYGIPTDRYRSVSNPYSAAPTPNQPVASTHRANSSGFFEELPMVARTRATTNIGRSTPQATPQQSSFPPPPVNQQPPVQNYPPVSTPAKTQDFGLVGPAKILPYSDPVSSLPSAPSQPVAPSTAGGRYSPAPVQQGPSTTMQQASNHAPRAVPPNPYAQANTAVGITRPPSAPYQHVPHKPSPLSRASSATHYRPGDQQAYPTAAETAQFSEGIRPSLLRHSQTLGELPVPNKTLEANQLGIVAGGDSSDRTINPAMISPELRHFHATSKQLPPLPAHLENKTTDIAPSAFQPVYSSPQLIREVESYSASQEKVLTAANRVRAPSLTSNNNFIPPDNESAQDPLIRWRGAPIFRFGFGGTVVTSFPTRTPQYGAGSRTPSIRCNPSEIRIHSAKILPANEIVASFPGPLKTKAKKKDVLLWLHNGIAALVQALPTTTGPDSGEDDQKRHEEKIMLWKVLATLVEHDGMLEGNVRALEALRVILSPEASASKSQQATTESHLPAISSPEGLFKPSTSTGSSLDILRQSLLNGDREKAVWHAVDQKLWGHAMLIASTMPQQTWRQVVNEFVRNEVKPAGRNTESLAALYNVFAGNCEESMDELVPPSARAGRTLMNKNSQNGVVSGGLDGLNRWRETLNLILSNRTTEDTKAIIAMAQLLASYGRFEAAHICYVLARRPGLFGGQDDPNTAVVLLGTDHKQFAFDYAHDLEGILLTEVFEFVNSTLVATPAHGFAMPQLQAFKLYHAEILADLGMKDEAQQYCDAITAAQKSNNSRSPYLNQRLSASVDELSLRLRQAGKDNAGSWMSRPNVDKVSGSFFKALSGFIAGDDDEDHTASAKADMEGPFARISGNTPEMLSRNTSPALGSGSLNVSQNYLPQSSTASGPVNSRYAPPILSPANIPQPMLSPERPPATKNTYAPFPSLQQTDSAPYQAMPYSQISPTPPGLKVASDGSPQASHFRLVDRTSSAAHNPYFSPPASEPGTLPSGQIHETRIPPRTLSPETNNNARSTTSGSSKNRYSPSPSYAARPPIEPRGSGYEPMSTTYQPRSYAPSPSLEPVQPSHVDSYQPSVPMYGYVPSDDVHTINNDQHAISGDDLPSHDDSPEQIASLQNRLPDNGTASGDVGDSFSNSYAPPSAGYMPTSAGFEAPSAGHQPSTYGYEPSYAGGEVTSQEEPANSPRKKKSFMDDDDDDDIVRRAAALKKPSKAKDREVDDAVRRAAEEDAKRDEAAKSGGGWFGSIWGRGGSKEAKQPETKAHQIKLGEENSFYYDKDLKKWINKKAGADAAKATAAAPPPPKGPPMRSVSAAPGPPASIRAPSNGPPGVVTSSLLPPRPDSAAGHLPTPPAGLAPPSRPGTGMSGASNASSVDDLMGPAQPRKGGTVKKSKKGRGYVDVLADKS